MSGAYLAADCFPGNFKARYVQIAHAVARNPRMNRTAAANRPIVAYPSASACFGAGKRSNERRMVMCFRSRGEMLE